MGFDFPNAPLIGQVFNSYVWDGEKWSSGSGLGSVYVSDTASSAAPVGSLWWQSSTGILFVRYFDGNSTQWVSISGGIADVVRYGVVQTLASSQRVQARQNVYAAPFDAMGYYGIQYNGSGEVDQSLLGNVTANNGFPYFTDGWNVYCGGVVQALGSPYTQDLPPGFQKHVRLYTTVGVAGALAAGDHGSMMHYIEGYRIARLAWGTANAQPLTLGFWIKTAFAGNAAVTVANAATSRSYTVDVACSGILEWKTITIPGCTDGVWSATNALGMQIIFNFGGGSTYRGAANVWNTSFSIATAATTNFQTALGNMSSVVGLMALPGTEAPSAERSAFVQRPFDQELIQCRRYFQKSYNYETAPGAAAPEGACFMYMVGLTSAANSAGHDVRFGVSMRANPTMIAYSPGTGATGKARDDAANADCSATIDYIGNQGFRYYAAPIAVTTNHNTRMHWTANARL